jgi:hypothetical protein
MHHEAALYMAQHLGLPITDARWQAPQLTMPREAITLGRPLAAGLERRGFCVRQRTGGAGGGAGRL